MNVTKKNIDTVKNIEILLKCIFTYNFAWESHWAVIEHTLPHRSPFFGITSIISPYISMNKSEKAVVF